MLKLPDQLADPQADEIVKVFVNERLIGLMEEVIIDEVAWDMALSGDLGEEDVFRPIEELVDIAALMNDMEFAENVSLTYLPENFPVDRANQEFFGLYHLLKAEKEYVPDPVKEYILYAIITMEIMQTDMINGDIEEGLFDLPDEFEDSFDDDFRNDMGDFSFLNEDSDDNEKYTTVEQFPEPERTIVTDAMRKMGEGSIRDEDKDMFIEIFLSKYEDLREYEGICFRNYDFLMLNDLTEEELINPELYKTLGIADPNPSNIIEFPFRNAEGEEKNIKAKIIVHPWDAEDEE